MPVSAVGDGHSTAGWGRSSVAPVPLLEHSAFAGEQPVRTSACNVMPSVPEEDEAPEHMSIDDEMDDMELDRQDARPGRTSDEDDFSDAIDSRSQVDGTARARDPATSNANGKRKRSLCVSPSCSPGASSSKQVRR